jgi:hypothetical protein
MSDMENNKVNTPDIDDKKVDTIIKRVEESVEEFLSGNEEKPDIMTNSLYLSEASNSSESDLVQRILKDIGSDESIPEVPNVSPASEKVEISDNSDVQEQQVEKKEEQEEELEEESEEEEEEEELEEESEEEEEEEEEEKHEDEYPEEVRYIQAIIVKENVNEFPTLITCTAMLLVSVYVLKLFFMFCELSGCNCKGHCICLY